MCSRVVVGLCTAHGLGSRFGVAGAKFVRVVGHLAEDVELPLEFTDPVVALVLLELARP